MTEAEMNLVFTDGFWNWSDESQEILEDNDKFLGGWFLWDEKTLEERIEIIENFLKNHNLLFIDTNGDLKEAVF